MELLQKVLTLSNSWYTGGRGNALQTAESMFPEKAEVSRLFGGISATLRGKSDRAIMLDAHIDEIAMFVTSIHGGFVKAAAAGGIDCRILPASEVIIHGTRDVPGVFCSTPPHLPDKPKGAGKTEDLYIDTGFENAGCIRPGDPVTFAATASPMSFGALTGKALDNRASCAVLLEVAERLANAELPRDVCFVFSDSEEIGMRGARVNAFKIDPVEAVVVDASFAVAPNLPPQACGKPGGGVMTGISPALDTNMYEQLTEICKEKNIAFQTEVMGGSTGTDADIIQTANSGVPTALCSIPLRNMHTPAETVWIKDLESAAELLTEYCLRGGVYRA